MGINVSFQQSVWAGGIGSVALGDARASEAIADAATGSLEAEDGEIAIVTNTGSAIAYVAHGSTPDSSATAKTAATSARYAIPPNVVVPFFVKPGDKFATAAS